MDDDHTFLKLTSGLLTQAGYAVESASGGQDAWDRLKPDFDKFDVVITDVQMPDCDGWWLVQLLKEHDFPGRIIVFSGALNRHTSAKFLAMGVDSVVGKDASPRELLKAVQNARWNEVSVTTSPHLRLRITSSGQEPEIAPEDSGRLTRYFRSGN